MTAVRMRLLWSSIRSGHRQGMVCSFQHRDGILRTPESTTLSISLGSAVGLTSSMHHDTSKWSAFTDQSTVAVVILMHVWNVSKWLNQDGSNAVGLNKIAAADVMNPLEH